MNLCIRDQNLPFATASVLFFIVEKEAETANDISSDTIGSMKKESTFSY